MTVAERTSSPPLPTSTVGRNGLRVTRLGVGTVPLGGMLGHVEDADASALVRRSYDLGIRFFDTAPQYGAGLAERRLGAVLRDLPRQELVVSTKVGRLLRRASFPGKVLRVLRQSVSEGRGGPRLIARNVAGVVSRLTGRGHGFPLGYPFESGEEAMESTFDFTYDGVMRSVEESLERLGLDHVELLLIHDPDDHHRQAVDEAYLALDRLRSEGTVRAIGVGMNHAEPLARFAREADFDCFLLAGRYTLLDQTGLDELLPLCSQRGIRVFVGGVFNSGLLADPRPGVSFDYHAVEADSPWLLRAQRLQAICARHDVPLAAAAMQFPFGHPAVAAVLCGVRSPAEIEANVGHLTWPVPAALWDDLRASGEISEGVPVPSGPVGEA